MVFGDSVGGGASIAGAADRRSWEGGWAKGGPGASASPVFAVTESDGKSCTGDGVAAWTCMEGMCSWLGFWNCCAASLCGYRTEASGGQRYWD